MSTLTKLSALRLQEKELLRTRCVACGHPVAVHSLATNQCAGEIAGPICRCVGFEDEPRLPV